MTTALEARRAYVPGVERLRHKWNARMIVPQKDNDRNVHS